MYNKLTVKELKDVPYPTCSTTCALVATIGVSECDNACPLKFPKEEELPREIKSKKEVKKCSGGFMPTRTFINKYLKRRG